jgi:DNA-binding NtrC family response regulator
MLSDLTNLRQDSLFEVGNSASSGRLTDKHAVLIIEKRYEQRTSWQSAITAAGFSATAVATCAEAVGRLRNQDYLILEINSADELGMSMLRHVRERDIAVKMIVLTLSEDPLFLTQLGALRPDGLFQKPVAVERIIDWLEADAAIRQDMTFSRGARGTGDLAVSARRLTWETLWRGC